MPSSTLTVAFVPGVSPAKWARVWNSRMEDATLVLRAIGASEVAVTLDGEADMCFARLPVEGDFRAIPLWEETPVAVLEKEHPLAALPALSLEDLEDQNVIEGHDEETLDLVATGSLIEPQHVVGPRQRVPQVRGLRPDDGQRPTRGGVLVELEVELGLPAGQPLPGRGAQCLDLGLVVTGADVLDPPRPPPGGPHDLHRDGP